MADVEAARFLLDSLSQTVGYHYNLLKNANDEVEQLTKDLDFFQAFLKYASRNKLKDERARELVKQIRDALFDADDVVDAFVTQTLSSKSKNWFKRLFSDTPRLDNIAQEVRKVGTNVAKAYGGKDKLDLALLEIGEEVAENVEPSQVREKNIVGLDKVADQLIGQLKEETPGRLDIISIIGMPGLGKSTLAGKIFRDPAIQYEFPTRLWVYVSKFTPKDVFLSILREFTSITEEMRGMDKRQLAAKVRAHLERGKFLIVMDDVWTSDDWSEVSAALPTSNQLGKILLTSRHVEVAQSATTHRSPHQMKLLEPEDSEKLLQFEVFGKPMWESGFEDRGRVIAQKCKGLPLAIVVIGGIIRKKLFSIADKVAQISAWIRFSEKVKEYLVEDPQGIMDKVILLSYEKLPYHLRACFLYFGMFPEDIEIRTWKLFRMWIAEGFIQQKIDFSLEETAEAYLEELVNRNLVTVDKISSDGKVKTCRIHDSLREFCKRQAGKDNESFLEEIRLSSDGVLKPSLHDDKEYRRLCIHSNISKFVASKPSGRRVRSFVSFCKEDSTVEAEHISAIPGGFKLLRVLDVKPIKFAKIPSDMYELLHLRYVHLSFNLGSLPTGFSKFWNMQTLILDTTQRCLEIKADIWKMRNLRHMKTNVTANLPEPTSASAQDENNIQTLGIISPEHCTDKVIERACNLRRLSIRGKLELLLTTGKFDKMVKLRKLEKLKLQNDVFPLAAAESPLPCLPSSGNFPPKLRILTLSDTYLDWSNMKVLASLDNLEVLKLKEKAFMGNYWEAVYGGFTRLKVLFIGRTDLVVWKTSADIFPGLIRLELENCDDLREVPIEFAQKSSLSLLILNHCRGAAASAKEIQKIKTGKLEAVGSKATEFKLSIFPPIKEDST